MQFIMAYTQLNFDKSLTERVLCIVASSTADIRAAVREAAATALCTGQATFQFCGHTLHVHDFLNRVSASKVDYVRQLRAAKGLPAPRTVEHFGEHYGFSAFELMPLDEWFSSNVSRLEVGAGELLDSAKPGS